VTAQLSPDCRAGKCAACVGQAWDDDTDEAAECPCECHVTIVATLSLPLPLDCMKALNAGLEAAYGLGLRIRQTGDVLEVIRR